MVKIKATYRVEIRGLGFPWDILTTCKTRAAAARLGNKLSQHNIEVQIRKIEDGAAAEDFGPQQIILRFVPLIMSPSRPPCLHNKGGKCCNPLFDNEGGMFDCENCTKFYVPPRSGNGLW